MTYRPNQFAAILPHVLETPEWLLLGGPADGDEAQRAVTEWPGIQILACEPNAEMRDWQHANGFPESGRLLPLALSDSSEPRSLTLIEGKPRSSTMSREIDLDEPGVSQIPIETTTLDDLSNQYGPFRHAILWLDIEGSEAKALRGARGLMAARAIDLINVEILRELESETEEIETLMREFEFDCAERWNKHRTHHDRIYVRKRSRADRIAIRRARAGA